MDHDAIDDIRVQLAAIYPDLDTSGLAVTGRILQLANRMQDTRDRRLEEFGLSLPDFDILATLRRHANDTGVNPRELQRSVMISSGGMTKRLDRLEHAGLTKRNPDPDDRRGVLVTLTAQGQELIDRALPALLATEREDVESALGTRRDRERLATLLRQLTTRAADVTGESHPPDDLTQPQRR